MKRERDDVVNDVVNDVVKKVNDVQKINCKKTTKEMRTKKESTATTNKNISDFVREQFSLFAQDSNKLKDAVIQYGHSLMITKSVHVEEIYVNMKKEEDMDIFLFERERYLCRGGEGEEFIVFCHTSQDRVEVLLSNEAAHCIDTNYKWSSERIIDVGFASLNVVLSQVVEKQTKYFGRCRHEIVRDKRINNERILYYPVYRKSAKNKFTNKLVWRYETRPYYLKNEKGRVTRNGHHLQTKKGNLYYHGERTTTPLFDPMINVPSFSRFDVLTCERICAAAAIDTLLLIRHVRTRQPSVIGWLPREVLRMILVYIHIDREHPAWSIPFFSSTSSLFWSVDYY